MSDGVFTLPNPYQEWGDKIHHNIFVSYVGSAVQVWQDFAQVYNNISVGTGSSSGGYFGTGSYTSGQGAIIANTVFYNNTAKAASIIFYGCGADTTLQPYLWLYNNISDHFGRYDNYNSSINIGAHSGANLAHTDTSNMHVNYNYVYRPQYTPFKVGGPQVYLSTDQFNIAYSTSNYQKTSTEGADNLYAGDVGADQYITRGSHIVSGVTTIYNGGIGGHHPYLSGVTLPSYIGATNPNDNTWVAGVLGLADVAILQAGTASDPSWIEGSGAVSDTIPPSAPQGLVVN